MSSKYCSDLQLPIYKTTGFKGTCLDTVCSVRYTDIAQDLMIQSVDDITCVLH